MDALTTGRTLPRVSAPTPPIRVLAGCLSVMLLTLCLYVMSCSAASAAQVSAPGLIANPMPTPDPQAGWTMAGSRQGDWDVYRSVKNITSIALEGQTIWATSEGGLLHWDPSTRHLTQYVYPRFPLPSNALVAVLRHSGSVYICGLDGLTVFDQANDWVFYSEADIGLANTSLCALAMVDEVLWLGGKDGIAQLFPDGHWEVVPSGREAFPSGRISRILPRPEGVYVVIAQEPPTETEGEVWRFASGRWERVDRPSALYIETPDGSLWKGEGEALLKSEDQGLSWNHVADLGPFARPQAVDSLGRLYATSGETVFVLAGRQVVEQYRLSDFGPQASYINILQWDQHGHLWIATDGCGLSMFDGVSWHNWQPENSPLSGRDVRGLAVTEQSVLAGIWDGDEGVDVLDIGSGNWSHVPPFSGTLSGESTTAITARAQGIVYFATAAGVLDIYDGQQWEHVAMPRPEGNNPSPIQATFDAQGHYWLANNRMGVWEYDGTTWRIYDVPGTITDLEFDRQGRLWVGTDEGLVVRDLDRTWSFYSLAQLPLGEGAVNGLAVDPQGRVWMAGLHALVVFNGESFQTFSPAVVGSYGWGDALVFSPEGELWVRVDSGGVARYSGTPSIAPFSRLLLTPSRQSREADITSYDRSRPFAGIASSTVLTWIAAALALGVAIVGVLVYLIRRDRDAC